MPNKLIKYRYVLWLLLLTGWQFSAFSQPIVQATIDRPSVLIGEPVHLTIQAKFKGYVAPETIVVWPDSLAHFELAEVDTCKRVFSNGQLTGFEQRFTLISFDSGFWNIPSAEIHLIREADNESVLLYTDTLPIQVAYQQLDSTAAMKDIKPILAAMDAPSLLEWTYWVGGGLLVIALIWLLWRIRKRQKKAFSAVRLTAYENAMQLLVQLKLSSLQSDAAKKAYFIALKELFKNYLTQKMGIAFSATDSSEILIAVKQTLKNELPIARVTKILAQCDAVQFAKFIPDNDEIELVSSELILVLQEIEALNPSQPV
jgi:hypothetical protein